MRYGTVGAVGAVVDKDADDLVSFAKNGNVEVLDALLEAGEVEVNKPNSQGVIPLFAAAAAGHEDFVRALLGVEGIDVNAAVPFQMHIAAMPVVGFKPETATMHGNTFNGIRVNDDGSLSPPPVFYVSSLYIAAQNNHAGVVTALLEKDDIAVDAPGPNGETPLAVAIRKEASSDIVNALLAKGADPRRCPQALIAAVIRGDLALVRRLIEKSADMNAPGPDCATPISAALKKDQFVIAKELFARGVSLSSVDPKLLLSALKKAISADPDFINFVLEMPAIRDIIAGTPVNELFSLALEKAKFDIAIKLKALGANPNFKFIKPGVGEVSLFFDSLLRARFDITNFLLKLDGLDVSSCGPRGNKPLAVAIEKKADAETIKALILKGVELPPNALISVVGIGDLELVRVLVRLLIERGISLDTEQHGPIPVTAFSLALRNSRLDIAQLLFDLGARLKDPKLQLINLFKRIPPFGGGMPLSDRNFINSFFSIKSLYETLTKSDLNELLAQALDKSEFEIATKLLALGADGNFVVMNSKLGRVKLLLNSLERGRADIADFILEEVKRLNVDGSPPSHITPLYLAAERGYVSVLMKLLNRGALKAGPRAFLELKALIEVALKAGKLEAAELLIRHQLENCTAIKIPGAARGPSLFASTGSPEQNAVQELLQVLNGEAAEASFDTTHAAALASVDWLKDLRAHLKTLLEKRAAVTGAPAAGAGAR